VAKIPMKPFTWAMMVLNTRKSLGLTQAKFAKKLGVNFATVNRWERGRSRKPLQVHKDRLDALAETTT